MTFSFPTSEATIDDTTYRVETSGAQVALLLAVVALGFLVALVIDARKQRGALANPIGLACVGIAAAVGTGLFTLMGMPYLTLFGGVDPRGVATLFHAVIEVDALCSAVGVGVLMGSIAVLVFRNEGRVQILRFFVPAILASLYPITREAQARELIGIGPVPFYAVHGPRQMHVGLERDVPVELVRPPGEVRVLGVALSHESEPQPVDAPTQAAWAHIDHVHVAANAKGKVPFTAEARHGPVSFSTKLSVDALAEKASPLLSLRVGDKLRYRVSAKSSDGTLLYFIRLAGSQSLHEVTVEVIGTRQRDGFRTFVLTVSTDTTRREIEVVAVDRQTRLYDVDRQLPGAEIVSYSADGEEGQADPIPCHFALLDGATAMCQRGGHPTDVQAPAVPLAKGTPAPAKKDVVARPPIQFAAAAPTTFDQSKSGNPGGFATAFVAVVTIGLVLLPDGSTTASYTLVATERGPAGAPEALSN